MKIIKFIKFWWKYNISQLEKNEPVSCLWYLTAILIYPIIIFYILFIDGTRDFIKESRIRRKKFWEEWNAKI
ncbi:MAG: hypothetical protein ACFFDN_02640 [Candidatus Hodarchaeota archaeon]